ncbi:MAG: hypothetical protein ACRC8Y_26995 [Chroococcales cyanobacterium]
MFVVTTLVVARVSWRKPGHPQFETEVPAWGLENIQRGRDESWRFLHAVTTEVVTTNQLSFFQRGRDESWRFLHAVTTEVVTTNKLSFNGGVMKAGAFFTR